MPKALTLFLPDLVTWRSSKGWFRPWLVGIGLIRINLYVSHAIIEIVISKLETGSMRTGVQQGSKIQGAGSNAARRRCPAAPSDPPKSGGGGQLPPPPPPFRHPCVVHYVSEFKWVTWRKNALTINTRLQTGLVIKASFFTACLPRIKSNLWKIYKIRLYKKWKICTCVLVVL